jgi:hypothetical protein
VRYRHNRGILHDGNFPHQSTPITNISAEVRRVILGFNCFPVELSECNLRAPEHSDAFNRTIRLYQTMATIGSSVTAANGKFDRTIEESLSPLGKQEKHSTSNGGVSVVDLMRNPALARLLVTAARKIKSKESAAANIIL